MNTRFLLIQVLIVAISACSPKMDKESTLILGTNASYPPYESVDKNGNIVGFDIDVAQALAQKLGKKLVVQNMSFDGLILALKQGKFHIIMGGISITPSRQQQVAMVPYQGEDVKSLSALFWKESPEGLSHLTDLAKLGKKSIAVQTGTYMENHLSKVENVKPKALESTTELVMDIQYKKSIAALVEPHIAATITANHPEVKRVDLTIPEEDWVLGNGIGISKNNPQMLLDVQNAIAALRKEGVLAQLESKWFKGAKT